MKQSSRKTYWTNAICKPGVGAGAVRHPNLPLGKAGDVIRRELAAMCNPGIVLVPAHAPAGTSLISPTHIKSSSYKAYSS